MQERDFIQTSGFTSFELLVVLTLITVTAVFLLNVGHQRLVDEKIQKVIGQLRAGVEYAHVQTMMLGHSLELSPKLSSLDWSQGMVLRDFLKNDTENSQIMATWQWRLPSGYHLFWHGAQSKKAVFFTADLAHAMSNGHFSFIRNGIEWRRVVINRLGYVHQDS